LPETISYGLINCFALILPLAFFDFRVDSLREREPLVERLPNALFRE